MNVLITWLENNASWLAALGGIATVAAVVLQIFKKSGSHKFASAKDASVANTGEIKESEIHITKTERSNNESD